MKIEAFRAALSKAKRRVVLAGAGCAYFRGNGGLWRKHDVLSLSTPAPFMGNPSRIWEKCVVCDMLRSVWLKIRVDSSFTLITQTIDGLDCRTIEQAYADAELPISDPVMIEMHGNIAGVLCTDYQCRHRELNPNSPICPSLAGTERLENSAVDSDIPVDDLPRCSRCGALARPDVVWFTEVPRRIEEAMRIVDSADMCVVVGTSAVVHPAATFSTKVKEHGGTDAVFNIESGKRDAMADFIFLGPWEAILPRCYVLYVMDLIFNWILERTLARGLGPTSGCLRAKLVP
ncbi:DHS-like NAD/FAD-binding domain-containing protein [Trametes elegans]|nr:DHS-like NAD/FAD-binding domain-containing protein [Trametes elegans]